ncbi:hypothetical protein [Microbacterium sp. Root1433D1]|uniref:hypothetical protein n=1 Tax=Microbacterium sp. Root1433D1 TaxID=1736463 RepID=UPI0012FAE3A2|nr:hypothetical protein [Microbacterium sp. Root1433D1]
MAKSTTGPTPASGGAITTEYAYDAWGRAVATKSTGDTDWWVEPGAVVVCAWFRRRRFRSGEIAAVDKQLYYGAGGAGVGWLPFVGSLRMIEIECVNGKRIPLPSTIGRRNRVLHLARRMREALGLPSR